MKAFHRNASACVKAKREMSEQFETKAGVRQGCKYLDHLWMARSEKKKAKIRHNTGVEMSRRKTKWKLNVIWR